MGRGNGGERMGKGEEGREGRLTVMHSWNRAADWLRPALPKGSKGLTGRRSVKHRVATGP